MPLDRTKPHSPCRRAFTTIEILIVVVILGITAAVAVPMIGNRSDIKLAAAARRLVADLQYAQNLSIASRDLVYVRFNADTYSLCRLSGSSLVVINHPVDHMPFTVTLGVTSPTSSTLNGVRMARPSFGGNSVLLFDAVGAPFSYNETTLARTTLSAQAAIVLTCGGLSQPIYVEPYTGEVSVP